MNADLNAVAWPASRLGELLKELASASGLPVTAAKAPDPPRNILEERGEALDEWIESVALSLGLEAEPAETSYSETDALLAHAGPAILRVRDHSGGEDMLLFLALLPGTHVSLLAPNLNVRRLPAQVVRAALARKIEEPALAEIEPLLEEARVPKRSRETVRAAILRERLRGERISGIWLLRQHVGTSFYGHLRRAGLPGRLAGLAAAHTAQYIFWILSWWLIGKAALEGQLNQGWLLAWGLLLMTLVPLMVLTTWLQGRLAIGVGGLLKQRLLCGALRLEPEEIRLQGSGQFLGRVIESQAVEALTLSGGFLALVSTIELVLGGFVLLIADLGLLLPLLLLAWVGFALLTAWGYFRRCQEWTTERLAMTDDLVESMIGHRTRLTQQPPERQHDGEDDAVQRYIEKSAAMDWRAVALMAMVPRGWLVVSVLGMSPAFVSAGRDPVALAVGMGGILLVYRALRKFSSGARNLAGAAIAWQRVAPVFQAASRPAGNTPPVAFGFRSSPPETATRQAVIEAHELVFRHGNRREPVLRGCSLRISAGDRILLEGPSGGGKSTLCSVLAGWRIPQSGLLHAGGLDCQSLGLDAWRQRVRGAPQFHENHVLTGTFAFNLLMGRGWPPQTKDIAEAEALCRELGLDELLARMPAGLLQTVGESGWQLSHGERSRLYIARTLLENPELIILDESFAQLDPQNLRRTLSCVLRRARTLLVIAHP